MFFWRPFLHVYFPSVYYPPPVLFFHEIQKEQLPNRPLKREVSWIEELEKESQKPKEEEIKPKEEAKEEEVKPKEEEIKPKEEAKEKKMRMEWWNMKSSQKVQSEKWEVIKTEEQEIDFLVEMHKQVREKGGRNVRIEIGENLEKDGETNQDYIFIRLVVHKEQN